MSDQLSHSVTRRWSEVLNTSAPLHDAQQSLLQSQYAGAEHVAVPPPSSASDVSITIPLPAPSSAAATTVVVDRRQAATILQAHEEPDRAFQKQQALQHDQYEYKQLPDKSVDAFEKPASSLAFQACTPTNNPRGRSQSSGNRSRSNSNKEYALDIKNMTLSFGKGKTILHKVNLQIEVGKIYGLLGPSGCGKTTLIKCILSQLEPQKGSVLCFGKKPGSIDSGVPGKDVGYMPQEIALYDEFTIEQNLSFYAKLQGMPTKKFKERAKYLCDMLDLKDTTSKSVYQLSGGQQRRTSLAIGLLHSPKLLILDEPTVGVDPTLRKKIWHYLKKISKKEHTAVLLTTHYIEEARQAHSVGFMRDGRMLKQGSPNAIIQETGSENLEDAFLKICKQDEKKRSKEKKKKNHDESEDDKESDDDTDDDDDANRSKRKSESKDEESESSSSSSSSDDDEDAERANEEEVGISTSPPSLLTQSSKQSSNESDDKDGKEHSSEPSSSKNLPISITVQQTFAAEAPDQQVLTTNFNLTAVEPASFNSLQQQDFKSPTGKRLPSNGRSRKHRIEAGKQGSEAAAKRHLQSPEPEAADEEQDTMLKKRSQKGNSEAMPSEEELTGWTLCCRRMACPRSAQLFGLCWKNIQRMLRGIAALVFQFLLPSIQVILFCVAIGKDPVHVHMGLVNMDIGYDSSIAPMLPSSAAVVPHFNPNQLSLPYEPDPENMGFLARDLYGFLNDRFIVHNYPTAEAAISAVQKNEVWGMVYIPADFTNTMLKRINETIYNPAKIDNSTLINSTVTYTLDMSNEQMSIYLVKSITGAYADVVQKYEPIILETAPLQQGEAVYGSNDASFTDFVAPGIIITIAFSGSIGLTAITFVLDKKTGNMDRIWASGVWASEIMLAQVITQLLIFIVQIGLLFIFGLVVFKLPMHGSVFLLFCISVLLGVTGMMFGLVIASKVSEERDAMQCALGSFFPALLLSGVMWPIEAIPIPLYWLALSLPTTWAAEAGRSIMSRGWGIEHRQVWLGIVVPFAWSFMFFLWAAKSLRAKK